MANIGKISQIIGPVVDVSFEEENATLPKILDSLEVTRPNGEKLVLEVQQHLGENRVRTVAMDSSEGLSKGMLALDTKVPISMPTGKAIRGRLFNVIGNTIDGMPQPQTETKRSIHSPAPKYEDLSIGSEVLYTGIKVIDLLEPYAKGGKIGLFGGAGVGDRTVCNHV